jgi:hypothetical protein
MDLISQIHTSGGYLEKGEYVYCATFDRAEHIESLKKEVKYAKDAAGDTLLFCNVHSGVDAWSDDDTYTYLRDVGKFEKTIGVKLVHETHRQRVFGSPFKTRDILTKNESFTQMRLPFASEIKLNVSRAEQSRKRKTKKYS